MSEEIERHYCYERPQDNTALLATMMNNQSKPFETAALMNGGMGGGWNGMQWLVWLYAMRWLGNNGMGENGVAYNTLQNQIQDNQNVNNLMNQLTQNNAALQDIATRTNTNIDFVRQSLCSLGAAITDVGGKVGYSAERVINAMNLGDANIVSQLQQCCCQTQKSIIEMSGENRLAMCQQTHSLVDHMTAGNVVLDKAITQLGFQNQQQHCETLTACCNNTQKIIDTLNNHWNNDLQLRYQDAKTELSQQSQTNALMTVLSQISAAIAKIPTTTTTTT